jgi:steroid delta-isomerase-like uncharacterized protein
VENSAGRMFKDLEIALNSHDVDKVTSFFTEDSVYEDIGAGNISCGKEEIRTYVRSMFDWSLDAKFESKLFFGAGNWVANEWIMSGTHSGGTPEMPATGKTFSVRGVSIAEIRDNKIIRYTDYWNLASFLQQVGVLPTGA